MKFERERWTPLTVIIETKEEAEFLHKILAIVVDDTDERFAMDLFWRLGEGLGDEANYKATGSITVTDVP